MTAPVSSLSSAPIADAATLILLRDGADGIEVLMMIRHDGADVAGGAMVFPGGKVDEADRLFCGHNAPGGDLDRFALASRITAIRESYEECGILLARQKGTDSVLSNAALHALQPRTQSAQDFSELIERAGLELATDLLVPFAHWITPTNHVKRFDTQFYLAVDTSDQIAVMDGREAVEVLWTAPDAALRGAEAGARYLLPPTRLNLEKLARYDKARDAIDAARREPVVTVIPEVIETETGFDVFIPAEAGYGVSFFQMTGPIPGLKE